MLYISYISIFCRNSPTLKGNPVLIKPGTYEKLNQAGCGPTTRQGFVLGGKDVPEGGLPFMAAFTVVSTETDQTSRVITSLLPNNFRRKG